MKATLSLILSLALAVVSAARVQTEPGAVVVNFDWKYAGYVRAETVKEYEPVPSRGGSGAYTISRKTIYVFKYTAKASLKNMGAKSIKAVSWDYVFTDKASQKEIKRLRIQSRQQILPGETATLSKDIGIDPREDTRQLSESKQSVEITRIEYADGSAWRKQ